MTDINNDFGTKKVNQLQTSGFDTAQPMEITQKNYTDKEIKNLDNAHAALVGRSMVKKMTKSDSLPNVDKKTLEGIKADLAELKENPALVKQAIAVADLAMQRGISYDKASAMAREFVDFHK